MALNGDPFADPMGQGPLAGMTPPLPTAPTPTVKPPAPKQPPIPKAKTAQPTEDALKANLASRGLSFRPDVGLYSMEQEQGGKQIMMSPLGYAYLEPTDPRATKGKGWYRVDDDGVITEETVPSPISAPAKLAALPDGSATMQIGEAVWKNTKQAGERGAGLYTPYGKFGDKREMLYRNAAHAVGSVGRVAKGFGNEVYAAGKGLAGAEADYVKTLKDLAVGDLKFADLPGALANSKVGEMIIGAADQGQRALGLHRLRGAYAEQEANDAQALLDDFKAQAPKDATQIPMAYLQQLASGGDQTEGALKRRQAGAVESTMLSQHSKIAKEILDVLGIKPNVRQSEAGTPPGINLHDVQLFVEAKQRLASYKMQGNNSVTLKNAFADEKLEDLAEDHRDVLLAAHALPKRDKAELSKDPEFVGLYKELDALKGQAAKIPDKDKAALDAAWKKAQDLTYRLNRLAVKPANRPQYDSAFSRYGEAGRIKSEFSRWLPECTDKNGVTKDYEEILKGDAARAGALGYDMATMLMGAQTLGVQGSLAKLGTGWLGSLGRSFAQSAAFSAPSLPNQITGSLERADAGKEVGTVLKDLAVRAGLDTVMFNDKLAKLGVPGDTIPRIIASKATRATALSVLSSLATSLQTGEPMDAEETGRTLSHFFAFEAQAAKHQIDTLPARRRLTTTYDSVDSAKRGIELAREQRTQDLMRTAIQLGMDPKGEDAPILKKKIEEIRGLLTEGMKDEAALQSMEHIPGKPKWTGTKSFAAPAQKPAGNGPASSRKVSPVPSKKPVATGPDAVKETMPPEPTAIAGSEVHIAGTENMVRPGPLPQSVVDQINKLAEISESKAETIKRLEDPKISDEDFDALTAEMDAVLPEGIGGHVRDGKYVFYNQNKGMAQPIDLEKAKAAAVQAKEAVQVSPEPAPLPTPQPVAKTESQPSAAGEAEPPKVSTERRADPERRKLVDEMTPEERASELLTSPVMAGLPNRRAYEEQQQQAPRQHIAFLDLDNFKDINDALGHKAGDRVLQEVGLDLQALRNGHNEGRPEEEQVSPFHLAGDEVVVTSDHPESIQEFMEKYRESISKKTIRVKDAAGKWHSIQHPGVSYGIGESQETAEVAAQADKQARREAGLRHDRDHGSPVVPAAEPGLPGRGDRRGVLPEPEAGKVAPRLTDIKIEDEEVVPEETSVFSVPAREKGEYALADIQTPADLHRLIAEQAASLKESAKTSTEASKKPSLDAKGEIAKGGFYDALKDMRKVILDAQGRIRSALDSDPGQRDKAFYDRQRRLEVLDDIHDAMRTVYPKLFTEEQAEMRKALPNIMLMAKNIAGGSHISTEAWDKFQMNVDTLGAKSEKDEAPLTLHQQATKIHTERELEANPDLPAHAYTIHEGERATHADRLSMAPAARRMLVAHEVLSGLSRLKRLDGMVSKALENLRTPSSKEGPAKTPVVLGTPVDQRARILEDIKQKTELRSRVEAELESIRQGQVRAPSGHVLALESQFADLTNLLRTRNKTLARLEDSAKQPQSQPAAAEVVESLPDKNLRFQAEEKRLLDDQKTIREGLDLMTQIRGDGPWSKDIDGIVSRWDAHVKSNTMASTFGTRPMEWTSNAAGEAIPLPFKDDVPIWDPRTGKEELTSTYQEGTRRHPETGTPVTGNYYSEDGWVKGLQKDLEKIAAKRVKADNPTTLNDIFAKTNEKGERELPVPETNGRPDKVVRLADRPDPEGKLKIVPTAGGILQGKGATPAEREADADRQLNEIQAAVDASVNGPKLQPVLADEDRRVAVSQGNLRISWTPREVTDPETGERRETDSVLGRLLKAGYVVIPGSRNELPRTKDRILQLPKGHRSIFERDLAAILGNAADPEVLLPAHILEKIHRPGDHQDLESDVRQVTAKDANRMNTPEEDLDAIFQANETKGFVRRVLQARSSDANMLAKRRADIVKQLFDGGILTPDDFMDAKRSLASLDGWSTERLSEMTPDLRDEVHTELFKLMNDPEFRIRPTAKGIWTRDMLAIVEQAAERKGISEELAEKVKTFMATDEGKALKPEELGAKIFELSGMTPEDLGVRTLRVGKDGEVIYPKMPGKVSAGPATPREFYAVRDGKLVAVPQEVPAEDVNLDLSKKRARKGKLPPASRPVEPSERMPLSDQPTPGLDNPEARKAEGWTMKPFSSMRGSDLPEALRLMIAKKMLGTAADNVLWRHLEGGKALTQGDRQALDAMVARTALNPGETFLDGMYERTGTPYGQPIRMMTKDGYAETLDPKLQEALLREGHPRFDEALQKATESIHELTPEEQAKADVADMPNDPGEAGFVPEGEGADTPVGKTNQEAGASSGNRSVRFSLEDYDGEVTDLTPDMEGLRELVAVNREHLANLSPDRRFTMSDLNGVVLKQARTLWRNVFGANEEGLAKRVWMAVNEAEDPERVRTYRHKVDQIVSAIDLISKPEEAIRFLESGGILSRNLKNENRRLVEFVKDNRQMFVDLVNNLDPRLVEQFKLNTHPYGGKGVMGVMNFARDLVKIYGNWKNAFDQIRNESAMGKLGQRIKAMGALPKEIGYQMTRNARAEASVRTVKVAVHETFHFLERHLNPEIQEDVLRAHQEVRDAFYSDPRNKGLAMLFGPGGAASDLLGGRSLVDVDDYAGSTLRKFVVDAKDELEQNGYELSGNKLYFDGKETVTWAKDGSAHIVAPGDAYRFASPSEFFAETAADILTGASRMGEGNLTERVSEYSSGVHSKLVNFIGSAGDLIGSFGFKTLNRMKPEHLSLMRDLIQDAIGSNESYSPVAASPLQKIAMDRARAEAEDAWADHVQSRDRLFKIAEASRPEQEWVHDYDTTRDGYPKKRSNWRLVRKGMKIDPGRALGKLVQATISADSMSDETLALAQLTNATVLRSMAHLQADAYHLEGNFSSDPGGRSKSILDKSVLKEHNGQVARMLKPQVDVAWNERKAGGYEETGAPGIVRVEIPAPGEKTGKMGYQVQYEPGTGKIVNYMSDRTAQMWHYLETDGHVSGDLLRPHEIKALDGAREYLREANAQMWAELASQPGIDKAALMELQKMNPGIWVMRRYTLNGETPSSLHYQTLGMDFLPETIDEIQSTGRASQDPRTTLTEALNRKAPANPAGGVLQGPAREAGRVKARSFMTLQEAMQHGYMSKYRNPVDAAIEGRRQLSNLILFRETVGHMEDMNLAVLASKGNRLNRESWVEYPLGGSKLTNRLLGFDYKRALLTPGEAADVRNGITMPPDVRLYVHASAIPLMNSVFGKGYSTQGWYRTLADLNAHLNPIQLLGLFHLGTTAGILNLGSKGATMMSDAVRALYGQNRANGLQPKEAFRAAWQHMKAARDSGNMWDGGKSLQSLLLDHAFETPAQIATNEHLSEIQKGFIRLAQAGGLNSMRNPLTEKQAAFSKANVLAKKTDYDRTMDFLNNGLQNMKAGVFTVESVMQKFQSGMMGGVIAPVKLNFAADNFGRYIARNYDITKDGWLTDLERDLSTPGSRTAKFALEVGDRADDIFGMSNIRKLYMDPRAKDLVTLLTRAFTWHKGNNRLLFKGMDEVLSTIPGVRQTYGKVKGAFGGHLIDKDAPRMGAAFIAAHAATTLAMNALIFGLLYKAGISGFAWSDEREEASGVRKMMLSLKDLTFPIQADTHGESFRRFDGSQRRMHAGYMKEWSDLVMDPVEGVKGLIVKGRSPVYELGKAITLAALGQEKYPDLPYGNPEEAQLMPQTAKDYLSETISESETGTAVDKAKAAAARMLVEVYNAPTPMTMGTLEKMNLRHSDGGETVPAITKALYLLGMRDVPLESKDNEE